MDEQQEQQPAELAFRRKLGNAFFYYHQECGKTEHQYENVLVADCAPETVCCGCRGKLHETPKYDC